ncbi:putative DNA polymerase delta subunit 2 [Trypanosoma rangeli]|uniref:Putative DNA polymerase delta subunit 2 n=1 Tax=Trypanosoma rangeli TaxID=5698 RepID=A0A422P247_TRYRA|nr:putative DNA polymerase delta subunit 2 [Trypanosoma rangeli]RNF11769.1 putative DNA polymerase delta subunit 2 [Trypanosoma rangeli]|eukprot:RNF11769.1 putative DNA polymerase delta subunit 2 [Trypanosoma rangeli]
MTQELSDGRHERPRRRAALSLRRTHQRFLLRQQQFTQQYAAMYQCREAALQPRALRAIRAMADAHVPTGGAAPPFARVLNLVPGQRALCVGVIYKQMRLLPRFLDEYQKELIRIDAGEDDEGEGDAADALCDAPPLVSEVGEGKEGGNNKTAEESGDRGETGQQPVSLCTPLDEVFMEDSSGRVLLQGVSVDLLCTGLVLGVDGTLRENGCLLVHSYTLPDLRDIYVPRLLPCSSPLPPCYVGIVCGLGLGSAQAPNAAGARIRTMVELLIDYLAGHVGDDAMVTQASRIARLVVAGNNIAPTDELRLKRKVKLDPSDHTRLSDDKQESGIVTSAMLMSELDAVLARLADTVDVDLMPGEQDMSNAFQPQQPLHPLLLPEAARRSSLKLVTNPYEFHAFPGEPLANAAATKASMEGGTIFFISAGSNLNDVSRETRYPTRLDAMTMLLRCGCACPTAPNTLFSYPFKVSDPFVFPSAPHCFVCCDQPEMQTQWMQLANFNPACGDTTNKVTSEDDSVGVRLICLPPFCQTGTLVLVDVNAPKLDTVVVNFASASQVAL